MLRYSGHKEPAPVPLSVASALSTGLSERRCLWLGRVPGWPQSWAPFSAAQRPLEALPGGQRQSGQEETGPGRLGRIKVNDRLARGHVLRAEALRASGGRHRAGRALRPGSICFGSWGPASAAAKHRWCPPAGKGWTREGAHPRGRGLPRCELPGGEGLTERGPRGWAGWQGAWLVSAAVTIGGIVTVHRALWGVGP